MNIHIELVKKWLNDPTSVTKAEREANKDAAYAAYAAADAAYAAAYAAAAYAHAANATYWVKRYEELTNDKEKDSE